ncbi:MAG: hypothetical protein HQK58_02560 [Deltaproteobacteria bacterium]|nr:hypothetical protein [Deltaproteobacteria bacterium]
MTDQDMVQKLLNGSSLITFMIPDSSMPSNYPEHWESYELPSVIINGSHFWGKSRNEHLFVGHTDSSAIIGLTAFCYTNIGDIFCSLGYPAEQTFQRNSTGIVLMSKRRYKKHVWNFSNDYNLIWDSDRKDPPENLMEGIQAGLMFKIAMLDSEGIWNIHPIYLPSYFPKSNQWVLDTSFDLYPMFFRYPEETKTIIGDNPSFYATRPKDNASGTLASVATVFYSFYRFYPNGKYTNFYDSLRGTVQEYRRLMVFSEVVK